MKEKSLAVIQRSVSLLLLAVLLIAPLAESNGRVGAQDRPATSSFSSYTSPVPVPAPNIKPYSPHPSKDALKWADEQLRRMSLEEKIGQLISVGINATFLNQDSDAFRVLKHQVEDNHVGGIILFRGPV